MPPVPAVEHLTSRALSAALDAAGLRQRVIAANIANAGTAGYVPQRVSFEAAVDAARAAQPGGITLRAHIEPVDPGATGGGGVALDGEVAALAENTVHQQILLRVLHRHLGLLATAASDGKR